MTCRQYGSLFLSLSTTTDIYTPTARCQLYARSDLLPSTADSHFTPGCRDKNPINILSKDQMLGSAPLGFKPKSFRSVVAQRLNHSIISDA